MLGGNGLGASGVAPLAALLTTGALLVVLPNATVLEASPMDEGGVPAASGQSADAPDLRSAVEGVQGALLQAEGLSGDAQRKVREAVGKLGEALQKIDDAELDDAMDRAADAAKRIREAREAGADLGDLASKLVEAARAEAAAATEMNRDTPRRDIPKAERKLAEGDEKADKGDLEGAIKAYKDAYKAATERKGIY